MSAFWAGFLLGVASVYVGTLLIGLFLVATFTVDSEEWA